MNDWDKILANYAATGTFHGKGQAAEDAYFAFFGRESTEGAAIRASLQKLCAGAARLSVSALIRWFGMQPLRRRL